MQICVSCPVKGCMWSFMPGKARIDAPGALHHIIVRCIKRRKIFRERFLMYEGLFHEKVVLWLGVFLKSV